MSNSVWDWSPTAANNNAAAPYGWTSGSMKPTDVEPTARQMMATIAEAVHSQVAGGTADALTVTYTNAPAAYTDGMEVKFRAAAANATTAPTLNVNSLGAKTVTRDGGVALQASDIAGDLAEHTVRYNLANTRWELVNPANARPSAVLVAVGSVTLDGTYVGKLVTDNASGVTITFPAANSVPVGAPLSFLHQQPGTLTLQPNGTDLIMSPDGWNATSLALSEMGDFVRFVSDGSGKWYQTGKAAPAIVNSTPVGASAYTSGTSVSATSGTFTAASNGTLIILGEGQANAAASAASLTASLGALTGSTGFNPAGTGSGTLQLMGWLNMTKGQTTTATVSLSTSTSVFTIVSLRLFFLPAE